MTFRVGQKVVCVDDTHVSDEVNVTSVFPIKGSVYTVANVFAADDELLLELIEVPQPGDDEYFPGFKAVRFRPVVERKTDISIFTAMLTPSSKDRVIALNDAEQ